MSETAIVALAGIGAAAVSPLLHGWFQARNQHEAQLLALRCETYTEALRVVNNVHDNFLTWASVPRTESMTEPSVDELRQVDARVRAIASGQVKQCMEATYDIGVKFYPKLEQARLAHQRRPDEEGDSAEAMQHRLELGRLADEFGEAITSLEAAIRQDLA